MAPPLLVVVDDLDPKGISVPPHETHAVLVVDTNAVLPGAIPAKRFELITRRHLQIVERDRGVQNGKFFERPNLQIRRQIPAPARLPQPLRFPVPETPDHLLYTNAVRYYCQAVVLRGT